VPKELVINRFFPEDKKKIEELKTKLENTEAALAEMEEEHSGEDGAFAELEKVNKGNVQKTAEGAEGRGTIAAAVANGCRTCCYIRR
jgi:type I restriction enzyme M protein